VLTLILIVKLFFFYVNYSVRRKVNESAHTLTKVTTFSARSQILVDISNRIEHILIKHSFVTQASSLVKKIWQNVLILFLIVKLYFFYVNYSVKFIRRKTNECAHTLTKVTTFSASSQILVDISNCIEHILVKHSFVTLDSTLIEKIWQNEQILFLIVKLFFLFLC
jgi:phenylalanyl-tRNA synthetase alpha subunit